MSKDKEVKKTWKPSGNKNSDQKIRCGQAFNLAIAVSIADNKQHDNEHIIKQYLRLYEFSNLLQKTTVDQLATILKDPEIITLIKKLDEKCK